MVIAYCRTNSDEKTFIGDRHREEKVMRKSLENDDDANAYTYRSFGFIPSTLTLVATMWQCSLWMRR